MKSKKHENQMFSRLGLLIHKYKILNIFKYLMYYFDRFICLFIKKGKNKEGKKKILILANLGLGDAINFLSVIDKYREKYPKDKYYITMWVSNYLDELFKQESCFDDIELVKFNQITTNIGKRIQLIKKIRKEYYDIIIDPMGLPGCSPSMYLMKCASAKEKITIQNLANTSCSKFFCNRIYTQIIRIDDKKISNIEYYNVLINNLLNIENDNIKFHKIKDCKLNLDLPEKYYIVFPNASSDLKKWEHEKYANIIEKIYKKTNLPVVFCGTNTDKKDVEKVIENINAPYIDLTGKSSVLEFIQIIKQAKFVITNDTGAFHIAVNEEIPVAIIAAGAVYSQYIAYDIKNSNIKKPYVITHLKDCFDCHDKCKYIKQNDKQWPCLSNISVNEAWNKINLMIEENYK